MKNIKIFIVYVSISFTRWWDAVKTATLKLWTKIKNAFKKLIGGK